MALKYRRTCRITNSMFSYDKCNFLGKEPGERDLLTEPASKEAYGPIETHQKHSNTANNRELPYGINNNEGDNNETSDSNKDDCCPGQHLLRLLSIRLPLEYNQLMPQSQSTSSPSPSPTAASPPTSIIPRRFERHKQPTQDTIESAQTEETYGRKPRAQRCREER